MDLALSPQDEAFRGEVRRFLDDNLTEDLREAGRKTGGVFADFAAGVRWHKVLARHGWSAPTWPRSCAGSPSPSTPGAPRWPSGSFLSFCPAGITEMSSEDEPRRAKLP